MHMRKKDLHVKQISRVTLVLQGLTGEYFSGLPRHWCELHDTMFAVCACEGTSHAFGSEHYPLIEVVD